MSEACCRLPRYTLCVVFGSSKLALAVGHLGLLVGGLDWLEAGGVYMAGMACCQQMDSAFCAHHKLMVCVCGRACLLHKQQQQASCDGASSSSSTAG